MITAKRQLLSVLILVVICVSALATEPNEPGAASKFMAVEEPNQSKTELKFEIRKKERQLGIEERSRFKDSVKPKYVAIFSMSDLSRFYDEPFIGFRDPGTAKMILTTSAGQSMSEIQKELLKVDKVISTISRIVKDQMYGIVRYRNVEETKFGLYTFTLEDAKLLTEAFVETMTKKAREKLPPLLEKFMNERKQKLQEYRERISDIKKKLSEKEPELKSAESAYKTLKNTDRYRSLADTEAVERAKETIAQMNKMLDSLHVELAGIREKLKVIQDYSSQHGKWTKEALAKLQELQIIQTIELGGAEARKKTALNLRNQDKQFCGFFYAWIGLESKVRGLKNSLRNDEKRMRFYEEEMANPHPKLLPPKVLQNKVTIYPVLVEE